MKNTLKNIFLLSICSLFSMPLYAKKIESVQENKQSVKNWNQFAKNIYQLHLKLIKNKKIKTSKRSGSYHRLPDFFQETKYIDTDTNTLLSRIERETLSPEKIHSIEIYIHDKDNKLVREYSASYLPKFRNAPYQTLINLHHYSGSIHSFRQFDASDNLLYEVCTETESKNKLFEHDDFEIPDDAQPGIANSKLYKECFQQLPRSASLHLTPH